MQFKNRLSLLDVAERSESKEALNACVDELVE
jgi:hypothetical protein